MIAQMRAWFGKHAGNLIALGLVMFNVLFWLYPSLWLGFLSVSDWRFFGTPSFSGTKNFTHVMTDPEFWTAFLNVWRFMLYYIPISLSASLAFAIGLRHVGRGKTFIALCFLLAYISSGVSYSLVFSKVFSSTGPLNSFLLHTFGVTVPWLTTPSLAIFSVSLVITWKFVGYYGLILYAGLNAIPKEIYDAAELDNSGPLRTLFRVTLPMMNAHLVTVVVLAITVAFAIFTEPYVMTGGGPMDSTTMPQLIMYETAFQRLRPGHAAMMAIITAVVSYIAIQLFRKLFERDVEIT
jgi:multiple sugar transport system permease protein